jgi:hypothetical protein
MNIVVNEELKAYIDPLTPDEHDALERSILAEGCRDALVLWGDVLVDGHNRYGICQKHGLPFQTVQSTLFRSLEDVHLWMIDQHLGRRSVSDFQRGVLALRKREIVARRRAQWLEEGARAEVGTQASESVAPEGDAPWASAEDEAAPMAPAPMKTREDIAKAARLSASQVVMIEKIHKQAAPALVEAVKSGVVSLNAAAAVATLPPEEQAQAVAGGKEQLREAAKRVREAKRKPKDTAPEAAAPVEGDAAATLRQQVARLTEENLALKAQVAALQATLAERG